MMTEQTFNPVSEPSASLTANAMMPAVRWDYFPKRHTGSGNIAFLDGHSAGFKYSYVFNANPGSVSRQENLNADIWWDPNRDVNP